MTTLKPNPLSEAVSKETGNTQLALLEPAIDTAALTAPTTIKCAYCGCEHTYIKKRKAKKFCSNRCGVAYHGKFVRNKTALAARVTAYYTKNYAK